MAATAPRAVLLAALIIPYAVSNTPPLPDSTGKGAPALEQKRIGETRIESPLQQKEVPKFAEPIHNLTVAVGREAVLTCIVDDLGAYKVAWLRVDTQTILTIHGHVITKNHRIGVTHSDHRTWYLHIKDVRESDRGWYMCQINTDPMKSQVGFLDVVVPPDISDYQTSTDMVVREGSNVSMKCAATGSPKPSITWRREAGDPIPIPTENDNKENKEVLSIEGPKFNLTRVNRLHMGAYLCIASNGVPPSVSKRILLIVHFPPMIWIQNQLVGAMEGEEMTLECHSEAFPKSINYWTRDNGDIISHGSKYEPVLIDNAYKIHMKLTIKSVGLQDYGAYKCVSKNSLGDTDGSIKLYHIPSPSTTPPTTVTTESTTTTVTTKAYEEIEKSIEVPSEVDLNEIAPPLPERDHSVRQGTGSRSRVQETSMDRSRYAESEAPSWSPCVLTLVLSCIAARLT